MTWRSTLTRNTPSMAANHHRRISRRIQQNWKTRDEPEEYPQTFCIEMECIHETRDSGLFSSAPSQEAVNPVFGNDLQPQRLDA